MMRAIIFDFDGTIADSFKIAVEIAHFLTHRSELVMPEEVVRLRKLRMIDVAHELKLPKRQWPFLLMRGRRQMAKRRAEVRPFPGIDKTLQTLRKDGYELYIMSSNSRVTIQKFLREHDLSNYFKEVYGGVGLLGKARSLRKVLKANSLTTKDALYVGDEQRDIQASQQVGIPCVAVAWGFNAPELLEEHHPLVVVRSAEELLSVLEEWGGTL